MKREFEKEEVFWRRFVKTYFTQRLLLLLFSGHFCLLYMREKNYTWDKGDVVIQKSETVILENSALCQLNCIEVNYFYVKLPSTVKYKEIPEF